MAIVPQTNGRFRQIMIVAQYADRRGAEDEALAGCGVEPQPARSQDAQKVAAGKDQGGRVQFAEAGHHAVGPGADLGHILSARTAVAEDFPSWPYLQY